MSTNKESLREQSDRVKEKINKEVEDILDWLLKKKNHEEFTSVEQAKLFTEGLENRLKLLKRVKDAYFE